MIVIEPCPNDVLHQALSLQLLAFVLVDEKGSCALESTNSLGMKGSSLPQKPHSFGQDVRLASLGVQHLHFALLVQARQCLIIKTLI